MILNTVHAFPLFSFADQPGNPTSDKPVVIVSIKHFKHVTVAENHPGKKLKGKKTSAHPVKLPNVSFSKYLPKRNRPTKKGQAGPKSGIDVSPTISESTERKHFQTR